MRARIRFRGIALFIGVLVLSSLFLRAQTDLVPAPGGICVMELGKWRIEYNMATGMENIYWKKSLVIARACAEVKLPGIVTSKDYKTRKVSRQPIQDRMGTGVEYVVESSNGDADKMIQRFSLYQNADYFVTDVAISRQPGATSNFMAPLMLQTPIRFPAGDNRALKVPFDNDKWIRYVAAPFGASATSYEVAAFYNNRSRQGLVVGSVEHDTWKTGIDSTTTRNTLDSLVVYGGASSQETRDTIPHGAISGPIIKSPAVFVGYFTDWRTGLETYAQANAAIAPPRPWTKGVPFGWNSWGKLKSHISFEKAIQVSDFFAKELQSHNFENNNTVYIGLDAYGDFLKPEQLKEFVDHCKAYNQEAGMYFTPFATWTHNDDAPVEGTNYKYKDLYLYANGKKQVLDGGIALDPTHPGTQQRIAFIVNRLKQAGFRYIKADFMTQGTLEADKHYDPQVTTGIQAYNKGMKFLSDTLGPDTYLNLSISPLFPAQYANSRRIACDTFGAMHEVEYALNSVTYGWWLDGVYDFNDPDHVVLDGFSEGENRARVTSAVITGNFISGDDFSAGGSEDGKKRAEKYLTNEEIDAVGRIGKSFHPVEGNTDKSAANLFVSQNKDYCYVAVFNYSNKNETFNVDFKRIGLDGHQTLDVKELWGGMISQASDSMTIKLGPEDAALYKIYKNGAAPLNTGI